MRLKALLPIFSSIFLAELGDKTQVATMLFMAGGTAATATEVFLASGSALVLSTFLAVIFGAVIVRLFSLKILRFSAGVVFLGMGAYYIFQGVSLLAV